MLSQAHYMALHNEQKERAYFLLSLPSSKDGDREMAVALKMERLWGMDKEKYQ